MMYDELIKRLRVFCEGCKLWDGCKCCLKDECSQQKSLQAADAIEKLQLYVDLYKDLTEKGEKVARKVIDKYPRWIPVTERLPENGTEVLAWSSSGFAYVDWWIDESWKVNGLVDGKHEFVTHWMPLPEPPKDGET